MSSDNDYRRIRLPWSVRNDCTTQSSDRFPSTLQQSSSNNVEIREYTRRLGDNTNKPLHSSIFDWTAFYDHSFRPQIFTDDCNHRGIEMKLNLSSYEPSEIQVSVDGNDLIVQAEHKSDRPVASSSRVSFYKKITLPPNTDLDSIQKRHSPDGQFCITAKLLEAAQR